MLYKTSDGTYCNDSAVSALPAGAMLLDDAAWEVRLGAAYVPSAASIKAANVKKIDADVDAIYAQAVGNRSLEYTTAEAQAQAYKDAGYTGTVPNFVASWVTASGLTATAAADNILGQAVAWRGAVAAIRSNRLMAKTNITNDVPTAMAQWNGFVAAIRGQLGL